LQERLYYRHKDIFYRSTTGGESESDNPNQIAMAKVESVGSLAGVGLYGGDRSDRDLVLALSNCRYPSSTACFLYSTQPSASSCSG
jgi:hypothetical protein